MLGRHGDDKPADAPGGECLQYAVVGLVKPPELQKGIDSGGKQAERRQIPRRSRFCGGQVLQYIYIHRSVVFKLRPVARRCRREAEGFDTHGSAGFQNRRIRQSQNSVQLFERQRKTEPPVAAGIENQEQCVRKKTAGGAAPDGMCDLAESNQKRYSLSSEKEKSLGRSPAWSDVWNSHQTGTRSSIRSASPSGRHSFER